jgi:ATP-dependent DNA helicase RecQ
MNHAQATELLRTALNNPEACFRDGQWEAIDALVNHRQKLLVVQRTGWGKSAVYFIGTRIFRDWGIGPTIIVSPLLALMRNQIESARHFNINAVTLNSTNQNDWQKMTQQILANQVDCLLISPERLANDDFVTTVLQPISARIALMVVDEAHCISDWGHDFRPDYRRIVNIMRQLPSNTPVLGTTATANNRVVADIQAQLGDILIQRGSLIRESLALQNIVLCDQASRLAWLAQTIPGLLGTGIIYTLTKHDAEQVAAWLSQNGIDTKAYHSKIRHPDFTDSDAYRQHLEELLLHNGLKVLVATTALSMGYDKPDLGFVIHYQAPGSIVAYYQQVGRAGRAINNAIGVLMSGTEDEDILAYFRRSAFPPLEQVNELLKVLSQYDGLTLHEIEVHTNLRHGQIEKVLKLLSVESPAPVIKAGSKWRKTVAPFAMNQQRIVHLTQQREQEWAEVRRYVASQSCLMRYLRNALDDVDPTACGKCAACLGKPIVETHIDPLMANRAASFLQHTEIPIHPNKQVAANAFIKYKFRGNLPVHLQAQEGRILSCWGDAGWGKIVAYDKHHNHFRSELVDAAAEMITKRWQPQDFPTWVCYVPSLNHPELVPDFARRLATRLGLLLVDAVKKVRANQPQKEQQNRFHQCKNLDGVFAITQTVPVGSVLLVDDIVDSGWTLTVIAALLLQAGSGPVYPFALASTSVKD